MDPAKRLMSARPRVELSLCCGMFKYFCNLPNLILHIFITCLLWFRISALAEDDPTAARILFGRVSFMASFVVVGYNTLILFTDCFLNGKSFDTIIKWLMQIVVFAGMGISGYYAFQCFLNW